MGTVMGILLMTGIFSLAVYLAVKTPCHAPERKFVLFFIYLVIELVILILVKVGTDEYKNTQYNNELRNEPYDAATAQLIQEYLDGEPIDCSQWFFQDDSVAIDRLEKYHQLFEDKSGKIWDQEIVNWWTYYEKVVAPMLDGQLKRVMKPAEATDEGSGS